MHELKLFMSLEVLVVDFLIRKPVLQMEESVEGHFGATFVI